MAVEQTAVGTMGEGNPTVSEESIPYPMGSNPIRKPMVRKGFVSLSEKGIISRDSGYVFVERNGAIIIDNKQSICNDLSFCTK